MVFAFSLFFHARTRLSLDSCILESISITLNHYSSASASLKLPQRVSWIGLWWLLDRPRSCQDSPQELKSLFLLCFSMHSEGSPFCIFEHPWSTFCLLLASKPSSNGSQGTSRELPRRLRELQRVNLGRKSSPSHWGTVTEWAQIWWYLHVFSWFLHF